MPDEPVADTAMFQHWLDDYWGGNAAARERLIEQSCRRMRRLTKRLLSNHPAVRTWAETQDIQQDASIRLVKALDAVRPTTARHFLNLAARHVRLEWLSLLRRLFGPEGPLKNEGHLTDLDGRPSGEGHGPSEAVELRDFHEHVNATLESLPEELQEIVHLRIYQGLTVQAVAEVLGVDQRTVYRRWAEALERLGRYPGLGGDR